MARKCPACHTLWTDEDRFCGNCGARLEAEAAAPPHDGEPAEEMSKSQVAVLWLLDLLPGLASAKVIIMSAVAITFAAVGIGVAVMLLKLGVVFAAFAAGGGSIICYWSALSWILYGEVCSPIEALAEFQSKHWTVLIMATLIPVGALFWYVKQIRDAAGA